MKNRNMRNKLIDFGLSNKEVIKKVPLISKIAKSVYKRIFVNNGTAKSDRLANTLDYSSLHVTEIKKLMERRYREKQAYNIACLWDEVRAKELNKCVIEMISPTDEKEILEIGCGIGGSAHYITHCKKFIGTELSEEAVSQAIQTFGNRKNFEFLAMDAMNLKFIDNQFDVVLAKEVIEHLPEPQNAIREAYRVLKPGGFFVVSSPNRDSLHLRINRILGYTDFKCSFDHIKEFTFQEAVDMLTKGGFKIKTTKGVFLQPYWGISMIDQHVRHLTDNDPQTVEILRDLGERVGAEYAFCFVILSIKLN